MSRRLYSDITIQSQNIDNWQIKRGSSEIGHTVKIQPHYSGSPQGSRSLLRIPGLGIERQYTGTASGHRQSLLHASSDETRCWG